MTKVAIVQTPRSWRRLLLARRSQANKIRAVIMRLTRSKSVVVGALLAATLLGAETAQAAIYTGTWDPAYGPKFPNLYWKADATFDVPTTCLAQGDNTYDLMGACSGFEITSATLSFYTNAGGSAGSLLESFTLDPSVYVGGVKIVGGQFAGVNTNYFAPVSPTASSAGYATDANGPYKFSLILFDSFAQLAYIGASTNSTICLSGIAPSSNCGFSTNTANGVFAPAVPEPSTYALLLAGIGAIAFAALRRRDRR